MHAVPGYLLLRLLGAGGSGEVWLARARSTGAEVAVKLVPAGSEDARLAVFAEAALLQALDHPHLVRLHEIVPAGEHLALVLDLAAAGSLADLLAGRGRLTAGEVITALAPIGAALAYAHASGVVHGDVSPGNILFTPAGFPLLGDLGLARLRGDVATARCTPAYADPGLAAGDLSSAASDVFALAAVAFHALTGETVWDGGTAEEVLATAAAGRIGDVAGALEAVGVPAETADVVAGGLALDPGHRPTAAEFALDLRCSSEPIAIELDAGRARREGVRPEAAFTQGVRLPAPQLHPAGAWGRHRRVDGRDGRRRSWPVAVAVGVVAAGVGGWYGFAGDALLAGSAPDVRRHAGPSISTSGAATPPVGNADAVAALERLDAIREHAFATRDAAALEGVYRASDLLGADTAMLRASVPSGCALLGVRNSYRNVTVAGRDVGQVVIRADVALQSSRLRCDGVPDAAVAGSAARPTTLTLVRVGPDYRISAISRTPITPGPVPARTGLPRAGP